MITLNRQERDLLCEHCHSDLDGMGSPFNEADHGEEWGRKASERIAVLDEIGWEPNGVRDEYEISMEPEAFRRLVQSFLDYAKEVYADDSREMLRFREGPIPNDWKPEGWSDEETRKDHRRQVDRAAEEMTTLDAVFMRAVELERDAVAG